ncbi:MAG TPA: DUF309 domain-containing protein [Abditibacteriaceae bacterium]|jgi:predicted metal-dependent hydrolase|nr:DUF309 domain-containing protein [Abditibacteriaceae bacterium]
MTFQTLQPALEEPIEYSMFWQLWREERFFECHEVLELLWKQTQTREKWFYAGLIHCAVSMYQHRRGNAYGACRQWWRATVKLHPFVPRHRDVEIEALLHHVEREIASSIEQLSTAQRAQRDIVRQSLEERMARDF